MAFLKRLLVLSVMLCTLSSFLQPISAYYTVKARADMEPSDPGTNSAEEATEGDPNSIASEILESVSNEKPPAAPDTENSSSEAPNTEAPTTKAPTTEAPSTEVPATKAPTTEAPTTKAPTTKVPTTEVPSTKAPTTEAPTTKAPTTEAPTTEVPSTKAPTTEAPTTEVPSTKAPTTEAPTTKAPTTEAPTTKAPTTEAPTTEAPSTEKPATGAITSAPATVKKEDKEQKEVIDFLEKFDSEAGKLKEATEEAEYTHKTNITDYNLQKLLEVKSRQAKFAQEMAKEAKHFDTYTMTEDQARQFLKIKDIGTAAQTNATKYRQLSETISKMETIYGTAKGCVAENECLPLEPNLTRIIGNNSATYDELLKAWEAWRDVTGPKTKKLYADYVELKDEAVKIGGYEDAGDQWRSSYETDTFEEDVRNLFEQIRPLYEQLHGYVRRRLKEKYGPDKFPRSGHIPAHLLGNMWAQHWEIIESVLPFPDKNSVDVTSALVEQNYNATKIFRTAESFFVSIGLDKMVDTFWTKSMLTKPEDGREVVCHASAWDFFNGHDFRIKMCTEINQVDFVTAHHEMGHIEYYMQYKYQPQVYRQGANPGFHEAIGDVMALSVQTPEHMHQIELLDDVDAISDNETDINFLMKMALQRVAFLPFGYLIDQWRWSVFRGDVAPEDYNAAWWDLRCRYQGISSPIKRKPTDFDPGAKYHIVADVAYIRYFVSYIIQFQFHKAACEAAGNKRALHRCDIYNSKEAGKKIKDMLSLGSSRPWQDAMEVMTGQRRMDASAILEYFAPLLEFLRKENKNDYGWDPKCPEFTEKKQETQKCEKSQPENGAETVHLSLTSVLVLLLFRALFV